MPPTLTESRGPRDSSPVYVRLLGAIPDTPGNRGLVALEDFVMTRDIFDKALPSPADSDEDVQEFYSGLWLPPLGSEGMEFPVLGVPAAPFLGPAQVISNGIAANLKHLSFDIRNMDYSIVAAPPGSSLR